MAMRLVIIGNSGSGKSTLANRIAIQAKLSAHDLDLLHWHVDGSKRDETEARALAADVAAGDAWVVEGVYGWLAEVAMHRATALVWLDLPWAECRKGLLQRGLRRGMTQNDQDALLVWAAAYWKRTTSSSLVGHQQMYDGFTGHKARLGTRADAAAFLSGACSVELASIPSALRQQRRSAPAGR